MSTIPASARAPDDFLFTEPEGRPFRAISIETEVDGPGPKLAKDLNSCGIIGTPYVMDYGTHPGTTHPHIAFLKHDGSVTAGEVVFDRIYLSNPTHAKAFRIATEKMRQLEKKGVIAYNPNCGGHTWVDASGFGFYDLLRLMVLFGHLEEPIFRLAGAGKTYGHRSLFKGYDRAHDGRGYSNPVVKGPFTDPVLAMNAFRTQHRMSGLNISKYLGSRCKGCSPPLQIRPKDALPDPKVEMKLSRWIASYTSSNGAPPSQVSIETEREYMMHQSGRAAGVDMKNCTCDHSQFAVEWRVWNAQSNPRILYAWIALMQAAHAYCWRPVDNPGYREHVDMLPLGWERRPFDGADLGYQKAAQTRVEFMFHELPLADVEKDALAYTFMRSPYKVWGKPFFTRLAQTPYKAPEYPNVYSGIPLRKIGDMVELQQELEATPSDPLVQHRQRVEQVEQAFARGQWLDSRYLTSTEHSPPLSPPPPTISTGTQRQRRVVRTVDPPEEAVMPLRTWRPSPLMPARGMSIPTRDPIWDELIAEAERIESLPPELPPQPAPDVGMGGE
jgi:hypothetical protein